MRILLRFAIPGILIVLSAWAGLATGSSTKSFVGRPAARSSNTDFEAVFDAHGGRSAITATTAARAQLVRLTWTDRDSFYEKLIELSTQGPSFERLIAGKQRGKTEIEVFDGLGTFRASSHLLADGDRVEYPLPSSSERLADVQAAIQSTGLLPLLIAFAQPGVEVTVKGAGSNGLEEFALKTRSGEFVVYADSAHLIRRVDAGSVVMLFADMREVPPLVLPFAEKILMNKRVVFDLYFSRVELNPAFPAGKFDPWNPAK